MTAARIAVLLAGLALFGLTPALAQPPASAPPASAPFMTGVTDAESLAAAVTARLTEARETLDRLATAAGPRTIAATLRAYDDVRVQINAAEGLTSAVRQLHPDPPMRAAAEKLEQSVKAFEAALSLNGDVYRALAAIDASAAPADAARYLQLVLRDYRRLGVDRDAATRARIADLQQQIVRLSQEFNRNVREDVRTLTLSGAAELDGLPPDFIAAHKPGPDGTITLTTNASDLQPVMTYARSDDLRRRMLMESQNAAYPANIGVLDRLVAARAELARVLGYPTWAAFDIADRMAATPEAAAAFIDRIVAASAAKAAADYREILERKRQDQPGADTVQAWERRYYTELVRRSNYDFNSQVMRPYFSYARVKAGVLSVSARLFGLEFRPVSTAPVWHPSVEAYEVFENGRLVARIYLDMFPRDGKGGGGASAATVRSGVRDRQIPEIVLVARLPGGQPGDPGLMSFDQVTAFFHEFGHLVHGVASARQAWIGLTRVTERDFMEAPSQMLEEWVSDAPTLATFATHYQTNEPIPAALVRQMRRASELGRGYDVRQQMVFAKLSLSLHDRDPKDAGVMEIYKDLMVRYLPTAYPEGTHFPVIFTQLSNPLYTSSYYTYMWSQVIAKDLFSGFDASNLLSPVAARRFYDVVLAAGAAKPAADLVRDFLGRPFAFGAWEAWLNQSTPPLSAAP